MLSNTIWSRAEHERIFARDGVLDRIDGAVYTSEIAWTKPHPEAFRAALDAVGVIEPGHALFVGDRPFDDIHGAKSVGMHAALIPHSDIPDSQKGPVEGEADAVVPPTCRRPGRGRLPALTPVSFSWVVIRPTSRPRERKRRAESGEGDGRRARRRQDAPARRPHRAGGECGLRTRAQVLGERAGARRRLQEEVAPGRGAPLLQFDRRAPAPRPRRQRGRGRGSRPAVRPGSTVPPPSRPGSRRAASRAPAASAGRALVGERKVRSEHP